MLQKIKYPRTFHFNWSEEIANDDKILKCTSGFDNKNVIVTEKMDGENTTLYSSYFHARSLDSAPHLSQSWVKNLHGKIQINIPINWRICGENIYAKHTIFYNNLISYFLVFGIWNNENYCLSWDDTLEYISLLGLHSVPIIYRGKFDKDIIHNTFLEYCSSLDRNSEGYVVRIVDRFSYDKFNKVVGKYVRKGHVNDDTHWKYKKIIPNQLIECLTYGE